MKTTLTFLTFGALTVAVILIWRIALEAESPRDEALKNVQAADVQSAEGSPADGAKRTTDIEGRKVIASPAPARSDRQLVPPNEAESKSKEQTSPNEERTAIEQVQDFLKNGGLREAYEAYGAIRECQSIPVTDVEFQAYFDSLERTRNDPDEPIETIVTSESEIERAKERRGECQALRDLKTQPFVDKLLGKAANGDHVARYLYAIWPPKDASSHYRETEAKMAYHPTALALTMANLEDGHPLGLLAIGLSYRSKQYFTPTDFDRGAAYLIAAELCSGGEFQLQQSIDNSLRGLENTDFPGRPNPEEVMEVGSRLYDAHCAKSIANTQP